MPPNKWLISGKGADATAGLDFMRAVNDTGTQADR
jgi:hypothetical protein